MLNILSGITRGNLLIIGKRKSGKTALAFYFASKLNKKRIIYLFSNMYNLINLIEKLNPNLNIFFKKFYKLDNLIEFIFEMDYMNDDTLLIFDDLSILNLEIKNIMEYYVKLNSFLAYLSLLAINKKYMNVFIINKDDEILNKAFNYWCNYILEINKEGDILKVSFKREERIKETILNIKDLLIWT